MKLKMKKSVGEKTQRWRGGNAEAGEEQETGEDEEIKRFQANKGGGEEKDGRKEEKWG